MIARSTLDGLWIGVVAGLVYAVLVAAAGAAGAGASTQGFLGLAAVVGLIAVPVGFVCGGVIGLIFGIIAAVRGRSSRWVEPLCVAILGLAFLAVVLAAAGVTGGTLAWAAGPVVVGTPAAMLHTHRLRRYRPRADSPALKAT